MKYLTKSEQEQVEKHLLAAMSVISDREVFFESQPPADKFKRAFLKLEEYQNNIQEFRDRIEDLDQEIS